MLCRVTVDALYQKLLILNSAEKAYPRSTGAREEWWSALAKVRQLLGQIEIKAKLPGQVAPGSPLIENAIQNSAP